MPIYVSTEEAKEYISTIHPEAESIPKNVDFGSTSNHLASAVIFAAMGESGQLHNLGQLYGHFNVLSPGLSDREAGYDRETIRSRSHRLFGIVQKSAEKRLEGGDSDSIIDALQFELANEWNFGRVVLVFAVDSSGTVVKVDHTGGVTGPKDRNYSRIMASRQQRIDNEFPQE